jgi:hypothetical protein
MGLPENPHPDAASDELADDGESRGGSIVPIANRVTARRETHHMSACEISESHHQSVVCAASLPAMCPVIAHLGHVCVQRRLDIWPVEVDLGVVAAAGVVTYRPHEPPMLQRARETMKLLNHSDASEEVETEMDCWCVHVWRRSWVRRHGRQPSCYV